MKHLRKFNENKEEVLDIEYINHCFAEILDDDDAEAEIDISDYDHRTAEVIKGDGKSCSFIYCEPIINNNIEDLDKYSNILWKLNQLSIKLKSGIDRLKDEYPNYKIEFHCEINSSDNKSIQRVVVLDISL